LERQFDLIQRDASHKYCSLKTKLTNPRILLAVFFLAFVTLFVSVQDKRRIIVTFDYDFGYDMTDEGRMKLFSIPVPGGAAGFVKGITGTSPPIRLPAGEHIVAVTAESANGLESDSGACATRIQVNG